jgi:LCP family protein required for cell wall assembly
MADGREHDHQGSGTGEPRRLGDAGEGCGGGEARGRRGAAAEAVRGGLSTRHRVVRWVVLGVSAAVLLTAAAGAFVYLRLNGNLRELPLFGGVSGDAGAERPDAFGRTPVNVLVIGSDTRADRADCRLGGACGPGQNADAQLVLHIAADRSHATVLSIPRDTVTELPACRRPGGGVAAARRGPVNSTLQFGPGCTVAAVHALTDLPIDHFVMADFAGVVRMSGAVGGVPVCVDRDVYDPYSHLKLAKGRHSLKGEAALQFLRSRHAFGNGGDLGRSDAQHLFLGSLARRMRAGGSLTDPAGLLSLADAATRSLTVDSGLASIAKLAGLADDVGKVPPARLVFTTMPSSPDPADHNRLVVTAAGRTLFAAIAADRPVEINGSPTSAGEARRRPAAGGVPSTAARGRTAAGRTACAEVARSATVAVRGVPMTPTAAFAATPRIPVSAR